MKRSGSAKKKAGRPPMVISQKVRDDIEFMAAVGTPVAVIADITGISEGTLKRRCLKELRDGHDRANIRVASTLFQRAMAGDTACMIFWLKTQAHWREPPREHDVRQLSVSLQSDSSKPDPAKMFVDLARALQIDGKSPVALLREHWIDDQDAEEPKE